MDFVLGVVLGIMLATAANVIVWVRCMRELGALRADVCRLAERVSIRSVPLYTRNGVTNLTVDKLP